MPFRPSREKMAFEMAATMDAEQQLAGQLGGQQQQTCEVARGLVADGRKVVGEAGTPELRDCAGWR